MKIKTFEQFDNWEDDDFEEEDEIDDPKIGVGDRVLITNYNDYNITIDGEKGEVIRAFYGEKYHGAYNQGDGNENYRIVVKFYNRRDLFSSKLSEHKDCYSFYVRYKIKKGTTDFPGKPEASIKKIG